MGPDGTTPKLATRSVEIDGVFKRLDGGSCLNKRSIIRACNMFDRDRGSGSGECLELGELLEALWVLEMMITSRHISFDGTLPKPDIAEAEERVASLVEGSGFSTEAFATVAPPDDKAQLAYVASSAMRALDDLSEESLAHHAAVRPGNGLDHPFSDADAERFFTELAKCEGEAKNAYETFLDGDLLKEMLRGSFRGSKCVAGIAANGEQAIADALAIADRQGMTPGLAMGSLINRFRFSYVRQLAFSGQDIYVPDDRWKELSRFHAVTFNEKVRQTLEDDAMGGLKRELSQWLVEGDPAAVGHQVALPPIGLYAIMCGSVKHPRDIVPFAHDEFAKYGLAFRKFWQTNRAVAPPEGGWIQTVGDNELDHYHEQVDRLLSDKLGKLDSSARQENPSTLQRVHTNVVDFLSGQAGEGAAKAGSEFAGAAMGGAAGATLGAMATPAGAIAGWAAGKAIGHLYAKGQYRLFGHIDQYRTLKKTIVDRFDARDRSNLQSRVEAIFGAKLVIRRPSMSPSGN